MEGVGLYVHIPFCTSKCNYCDFVSFPYAMVKHQSTDYFQALKTEMELIRENYGALAVNTVYFGGGTPSLVSESFIDYVLSHIRRYFCINDDIEISIEANPETVTLNKFKAYADMGINRVSLGVQTDSEDCLIEMSRHHSWKDVIHAIECVREAGFTNLGVDLIYGLPGQSLEQWENTVRKVLEQKPEHMSLYGLKLSQETVWGRLAAAGTLTLPNEDQQADMYLEAQEIVRRAGLEQYEISNYAKPGFQSRHNLIYWRGQHYLGIGVSAASYYNKYRWSNYQLLSQYITSLKDRSWPREEMLTLSKKEEMAETIIMGLRLVKEGVSIPAFEERFGVSMHQIYEKEIVSLTEGGLIEENNRQLLLTERARLLANEVFREFI